MKPQCKNCRRRVTKTGARFCTQRCAAEWAEMMTNDEHWCVNYWGPGEGRWAEDGSPCKCDHDPLYEALTENCTE